MKSKTQRYPTMALMLIAVAAAPAAHAVGLDTLIAGNGTVTQGNLVFSNFSGSTLGGALTTASVDVTGIVTASGANGLRFTGVPNGAFSQSSTGAGGGGAREIIVDVGFTVTVNDVSFRIHGVQQAFDPAAIAHNNAILNDITNIPPAGTPIASLFGCVAGTGLPSGQTCTTPVDSAILNSDASTLIVDRQIQVIVGQKGGATVGDASTGFFDVSFSESTCSSPPTAPTASSNSPVCEGGTLQLSAGVMAGATYSWTGPNGFTSAVELPTVFPVTAAAAGVYSVTVTVGGCTSAAGTTAVAVNTLPGTPAITAPATAASGQTGLLASVPVNAGSTFAWSLSNGTITSGQGTNQISFTSGVAGSLALSVTETNSSGCTSAAGTASLTVTPIGSALLFFTLAPCRILDSRNPPGPLGGPSLQPASTRTFDVAASSCGVPAGAVAISANLTVTNGGAVGELVVFPSDVPRPNTSAISFRAGRARANNAVVKFSSSSATFSVFDDSPSAVDLILDVNGYFR